MKVACVSFTEAGAILGNQLEKKSHGLYTICHYANNQVAGGIKGLLNHLWQTYEGLIFISSTGIAVRLIQPYMEHKAVDPAVVVVDDLGKFSISLLSGHLGGANELAKWIGEEVGAFPVITTASDNRDIEAVDLFAKKNNYAIEDIQSLTRITALMVNGKTIGFYSEDNQTISYPHQVNLKTLKEISTHIEGLIIVSSRRLKLDYLTIPYALLRPQNINIGIGCRKGVEKERIIEAIEKVLIQIDISCYSIKAIGTVEVKKDEEGIIEAAKYFNCPMRVFTIEEIKAIEDQFEKSEFVKQTIGVYSVSEPVAYLLGGELIINKQRHNGITISIAKEV